MGLCCFAFVITLHTYLKLIELITDKTVFGLSVGCIQLPVWWIPQSCATFGGGLLAFGVGGLPWQSWEGTHRPFLPFLEGVWSRGLLQSEGAHLPVSRCRWDGGPEGVMKTSGS